MEQPEYIDNLIASALSGEASPEQLRELEQWKLAAPSNMDYFRGMEKIMLTAETVKHSHEFNTDKAWIKLKQNIAENKSKGKIRTMGPRSAFNDFLRIAAMLLLFTGIGFAVYKIVSTENSPAVIVESGDAIRELSLPDSTSMVLNRHSKCTFTFSSNKRSVELHGEAFFAVAHDIQRPFEVKAAGIVIRDIGTAFNVKAHDGNDSMTVVVSEGEVMMTSENGGSINLKKGESAIYLKSSDAFIHQSVTDTNATSYRTKIFVFENATLTMVTEKISEVYGIRLIAVPAVAECHLTVTFKNENPDKIIDIIAETLQLTIKRENNSIILDGTDCGQ